MSENKSKAIWRIIKNESGRITAIEQLPSTLKVIIHLD